VAATTRSHTPGAEIANRCAVQIAGGAWSYRQYVPAGSNVSDLADQVLLRIVAISFVKASEPNPNHISDAGAGILAST